MPVGLSGLEPLTSALSGVRSVAETRPLPTGAVSTAVRRRRSPRGGVDKQIDKQVTRWRADRRGPRGCQQSARRRAASPARRFGRSRQGLLTFATWIRANVQDDPSWYARRRLTLLADGFPTT